MIAVTGVGAVSALGQGAHALFDGLCQGRSGAVDSPFPGFERPVAALPGAGDRRTSALAVAAALEAVAGFDALAGLAVVGASTSGDMQRGEAAYRRVLEGGALDDPMDYVWRQLCHESTRAVCAALGAAGPRLTLSTACTSGACAIGVAADLIRLGRAPAALAVGADALCLTTLHGFDALGVYAPEPSRPFDAERRGITLGEGAAALLLEPLDAALARGARPLALLAGYGNASDAHHLTAPHPEGRGARAAIRAALGDFPAASVGYVCAHATGTPQGDAMEAGALAEALPAAAVSGVKGAVGHTLGAAGALEAVVAVLAVHQGRLPPNVGMERSDFPLDLIRRVRSAPIRAAMSVNFAFGGNNTAILVRRCAP